MEELHVRTINIEQGTIHIAVNFGESTPSHNEGAGDEVNYNLFRRKHARVKSSLGGVRSDRP